MRHFLSQSEVKRLLHALVPGWIIVIYSYHPAQQVIKTVQLVQNASARVRLEPGRDIILVQYWFLYIS